MLAEMTEEQRQELLEQLFEKQKPGRGTGKEMRELVGAAVVDELVAECNKLHILEEHGE